MIQLNTDFSLLNKFFGIPISRLVQYKNKELEEIMKIEAAQGNEKAANYEKILSDPQKVYEIFKLSNLENKYIILQNMSESDLDNLLPFLKQEHLVMGLNFFTEEKLLAMTKELPIEILLSMMFEKFAPMDMLMLMDENAMNQIIAQPDIERKYAQNYLEQLDQKTLEMIMVQSFGVDFKDKSRDEYLTHVEELNESDYKRFLMSFEREQKMLLINGLVEQEPDFMMLFKPEDIARPMEMLMKGDKIKLMSSLDSEFLIPMIQELPVDLTQIVLTQIDPKEFADILTDDFKNILSSVVLFSGGK